MSIEVRNVSKNFNAFKALNSINLDIQSGELVALLGPSGCGKTTLLRIIAGLETPDTGSIVFHGEDVSGHDVRDRNVGFVFQHYALFRHMTVFDNVAFGLRMKPKNQRPNESQIAVKVHELLNMVQLDWLSDRYPEQLSGGQRQRIALARALAVEPKVLLLDEPFGALDAKVRKELRRWLARLHEDINLTSVFVTHDQEEAMEVADRIVVMNKGVIEQIGSPGDVYENPASDFVYHFLGDSNRLHLGGDQHVLFRPHEVSLSRHELEDHHAAEVRDIRPLGATTRVDVESRRPERTDRSRSGERPRQPDRPWRGARPCSSNPRSGKKPKYTTTPNVGGGLPPIAVYQSISSVTDPPPSGASPLPHSNFSRLQIAASDWPGAAFNLLFELVPQPQQKRQLRHHKQRPDDQPRHIIHKRRLLAFVVMPDKLNHPTHHEHTDTAAEPDRRALRRQYMPGPHRQAHQHAHQHAQREFQAQVEPRRKQRDDQRRRQPEPGQRPLRA